MNRNLGLLLVVIGVLLIGATVLLTGSKQPTEQKLVEAKLNEEQMQYLIKEMQKYLTPADNINSETTFEIDEMIKFAFSYTVYLDKNSEFTEYNEVTEKGSADVNKIKENIELIFGVKNIDLSSSSYDVVDGKIKDIDLNTQGGDAVIYKFDQRTVNEATGVYITDIDCLEYTNGNEQSTLLTKSEYSEEDVVYTLQIKYTVIDGRKILLGYSAYTNYEY